MPIWDYSKLLCCNVFVFSVIQLNWYEQIKCHPHPMPSEVCKRHSNSLFAESHSCCSAERAHEEFVKVSPYDRWGTFMDPVSHLFLFSPPYSGPMPHSSPCTTPSPNTCLFVFFIYPPFPTSSRDDRNNTLDDSLHPSFQTPGATNKRLCIWIK